jgi:hypothetical protein
MTGRVLAGAAAVAACVGTWLALRGETPPPTEASAARVEPATPESPALAPASVADLAPERRAETRPASETSPPPTEPDDGRRRAPDGIPTVEVAGRVLDPDGRPLAGLRLRSDRSRGDGSQHATTDEGGRFRIAVPAFGHARVVSEDPAWFAQWIVLPESEPQLVAREGFRLVVTAQDEASGAPIAAFAVRASGERFYESLPATEGRVEVRGPRPPLGRTLRLAVSATAQGYAPVEAPVEVAATGDPQAVVLRLPPVRPGDEARVRIEVLDAAGTPLDGDWVVRIVDPDDRRIVQDFGVPTRVEAGLYEATLPPGWWTVLVKSNDWMGFLRSTERANLVSGANVVRARMAPHGTLVVRWPAEAAPTDAHEAPLSVSPLAGGAGSGVANLAGKSEFRTPLCPEGAWKVRFRDEARHATVRAGGETVVDFGLPATD